MRLLLAAATLAPYVVLGCATSGADAPAPGVDAGVVVDASVADVSTDAAVDVAMDDAASEADVVEAAAPTTMASLRNTTGSQIYPGGGYRYGPSIIRHPDASVDMWTCSPGADGAWDYIRWRHSTDDGVTWTDDQIALEPTAGSPDAYSTCDPGAIMIGGYFYIGYTSTTNSAGTQNDVFVARSMSPSGPFDKWNGASWGGTPTPVVTYTGDPTKYGMGEPSFVLFDDALYLYFTDADATGNYTDLAIAQDPTMDDWPARLAMQGHVVTKASTQDSLDVKYDDALARFVAVSTFDRFGPNSTVRAYESIDGLLFDPVPFLGARLQDGAHNIGISGNESAHIDGTANEFIAYAYAPAGSAWGNWPTFVDPVAIATTSLGTTCGGDVSSIVGGDDWGWSGPRAFDDDETTVFSSIQDSTAASTEWAFVDLGRALSITGVVLVPRAMGLGYPVDFELQGSLDGATWTALPGQTYTGHAAATAPETFTFAATTTRFVRVYATTLGTDDTGNFYLQLAEIRVVQ